MKIAVPTKENVVDSHFGHCEEYTLFSVNCDHEITFTEILRSSMGCGFKENIASFLKENGVTVMLAGNVEDKTVNILNTYGIDVYRGHEGDIHIAVKNFLQERETKTDKSCSCDR